MYIVAKFSGILYKYYNPKVSKKKIKPYLSFSSSETDGNYLN